MTGLRNRRRVAVQALYQLDNSGPQDESLVSNEAIREFIEADEISEEVFQEGLQLARDTWSHREAADSDLEPLTPDWPLHRQPVVDRNLLRLAWYEMNKAGTPPKVVISESVDLAREFSTEQSPSFINGVLDRLYHDMIEASEPSTESTPPDPAS
ncbi:MAG: transcription antitermination factor NusB [Phycisphaerae bacterium]|nr:transcription antitermination factor NusB [Phycisphaerae bacterium]|tara:strand:+ start:100 stop:564 length:465 start_codon:yes stop_codon:yes gene_type:complete